MHRRMRDLAQVNFSGDAGPVSGSGKKGSGTMQGMGACEMQPELKTLVAEASRALARLDADRLEELALSCQALNQEVAPENRSELARQTGEAAQDIAVLARVLEATRENLRVMNRLREIRAGRLEYRERQVLGRLGTGDAHGVD